MLLPLGDLVPEVDPTAWVAPNATIVGAVTLLEGSSVWYAATVRCEVERITLGAGSNLQDGVTCHTDLGLQLTIGSGVSVGHNAVLHGCTIEDDVLVGMGAVVMNGAVIGAGSMIGAGALVSPGTVVPPRSLVVGTPGKVRRETTDDELALIRLNAEHYGHLRDAHRAAVDKAASR